MYYLGELARKPCTRQEVFGSNPAGCKKFFSVWGILSRLEAPTRTKDPLLSRLVAPPGTKRPNPFIPVGNTNPDKRTLLSRLVLPTWTKDLST